MDFFLIYALVGALAGLLGGMLGLGGGVVVVPALVAVLPLAGIAGAVLMHLAVGTSLAAIVVTTASSTWAHARRGAVDWTVFAAMAPGLALGAAAGALLADRLTSTTLARVFGAFVLAVAVQTFAGARAPGRRPLPGTAPLLAWGGVIGTASAVLGIGGGSLTVPLLTYCRMAMPRAVATSSACGIVLGVVGGAGFALAGAGHADLPAGTSGYVYWPAFAGVALASVLTAPLGARLAHRLPTVTLKRVFAVVLGLTGLRMLLG